MGHLLSSWFAWPDGGVWSNLVASGITGGLVWWRARVHIHRVHKAHTEHVTAEVERILHHFHGGH